MNLQSARAGRVTYYDTARGLIEASRRNIVPTPVVLDIGCGIRPMTYFFQPETLICLEPHEEYYSVLQTVARRNPRITIIRDEAIEALPKFLDKSVDSIFLVDVIEHMEKETGLKVIRECERIVRKQIAIFTPLGWMDQHYVEGEKDAWGLNGTF